MIGWALSSNKPFEVFIEKWKIWKTVAKKSKPVQKCRKESFYFFPFSKATSAWKKTGAALVNFMGLYGVLVFMLAHTNVYSPEHLGGGTGL